VKEGDYRSTNKKLVMHVSDAMFGLTGTLTASGHRSVKWMHAFSTSQQNVWFSVLPRRSRSSVVRKRLFAREAASLDPCVITERAKGG
jgi:hypothetical protein